MVEFHESQQEKKFDNQKEEKRNKNEKRIKKKTNCVAGSWKQTPQILEMLEIDAKR